MTEDFEDFEDDCQDYEYINLEEETPGIYFYVVTEYNDDHELVKKKIKNKRFIQESKPVATYPEGRKLLRMSAGRIRKTYSNSKILDVPDEDREDIFSTYIFDNTENFIARLGVTLVDYRDVTLH